MDQDHALDDLRTSPYMSRLSGEATCTLTLWVLAPKSAPQPAPRLAYGHVVPAPHALTGRWGKADVEGDPRLVRLTLHAPAEKLWRLTQRLRAGENLQAACAAAGLPTPDPLYGWLVLAATPEGARRAYRWRPVALLGCVGDASRGEVRLSYVPEAITATGALTCVDKMRLCREAGLGWQGLRRVLEVLSSETGLDFRGRDAGRLGDLEFLDATGVDDQGKPMVKAETVRVPLDPATLEPASEATDRTLTSVRRVTVRLEPEALEPGSQVLLGCRLRSGGEVILAEAVEATVGEGGLEEPFTAPGEVDGVDVAVWQQQDGRWRLWYEASWGVIQQINVTMAVPAGRGVIESGWTREYGKPGSRAAAPTRAAAAFEQVTYQPAVVGDPGRSLAPWVPAAAEARQLAARLFPEPSGARWFAHDWSDKDAPGFVDFVDWFKGLTADPAASRVLLLDPYFDDLGVELLARARSQNAEYEVLTCSQQRGDGDGAEEAANAEPPRARRLLAAAMKLRKVLSGLRVRVLDLRSVKGGKQGLFHDRYLLVYGPDDQPLRGFNLSNSIQWRHERYPLLATPIPADVLPDVAEYARQLREAQPPAVHEAKVLTLYDTAQAAAAAPPPENHSRRELAWHRRFYAALLGDSSLGALEEPALYQELHRRGFNRSPDAHDPDLERVASGYSALARRLEQAGEGEFAELWSALLGFLCTVNGPETVFDAVAAHSSGLGDRLERFLLGATGLDAPIGSRGCPQGLQEAGWLVLFKDPAPGLGHTRLLEPVPGAWGIRLTAQLLLRLDPERVVGALEAMHARACSIEVANADGADEMILWVRAVLSTLHRALEVRRDDALMRALLRSPVPLLRRLAVGHLARACAEAPYPRYSAEEALTLLDAAPGAPARAEPALEWLDCLLAEGAGQREHPRVSGLRRALFGRLTDTLPDQRVLEAVDRALRALELEGREAGRAARLLQEEWVSGLVEAGRLTPDEAAGLWQDRLVGRLKDWLRGPRAGEGWGGSDRFRRGLDDELTEAAAAALAGAGLAALDRCAAELEPLVKKARRTLGRPWIRAKDHSAFSRARGVLVWVDLLLTRVRLAGVGTLPPGWGRLEEALQPLRAAFCTEALHDLGALGEAYAAARRQLPECSDPDTLEA